MQPSIFLGHGSPMNIVDNNEFTKSLVGLSKELNNPKYILVISAHWLTNGTYITYEEEGKQLYDFYGFPDELYNYKYNYFGSKKYSNELINELNEFNIKLELNRGIDHGGWTLLKYLFPSANIPVIQMSIDISKNFNYYLELGKKLSKLREENVLILGSGNIVHNLQLIDFNTDSKPFDWAIKFDETIKNYIISNNIEGIINYENIGLISKLSQPTNEHLIPLIYILGTKKFDENIQFIYNGFQNKTISMRSLIIRK